MLRVGTSLWAMAMMLGMATPVAGQEAPRSALDAELAEMRAQMQRMNARIDALQSELAAANARAAAASEAAAQASSEAASANAAAASATTAAVAAGNRAADPIQVAWKGAPEFSDGKGWSFKPRGRLQLDAGGIDGPAHVAGGENLGFSAELRRMFIGFDGSMPGGFSYRVEADLANSDVQLTDVFLTYAASKRLSLTVGHHKPFNSMDELTSDLFTSMMERAAFTTAFGFERRVGLSATYLGKGFMAQGGVFTDDAASLNSDLDKSWSVDGRLVAMPKVAGGTLHLAASAHWRDLNGSVDSVRYRVRPFLHTSDLRFVDTGTFAADGERGLGLEAAWFRGRFHAASESFWQTVRRPGAADPTFNGGYAELGAFLTDDANAYRNGVIDRVKPEAPVGSGGIGAVQLNLRYDWLDLSDAGIVGGRQDTAGIALLWMPTAYVRFIVSYGHMWVRDAALADAGDRSYGADAAGMRAQFDF